MNSYPSWLTHICATLKPIGINLVGTCSGKEYQHLLPDCQSIVVFGNYGRGLWEAFLNDIKQHPQHLSQHQHPLDDFVLRNIQKSDPSPPSSRRWIRCAADEKTFVDFRMLAHHAGLGCISPVGLLIHPEFGLWTGFRAALLSTQKIPLSPPSVDVCTSCATKVCISSCPAQAVQTTGWSVQKCADFHQQSTLCHGRCHARLECPIGSSYKHGKLQHEYHNTRTSGRKKLAQQLKIADPYTGIDPNWNSWGSQ